MSRRAPLIGCVLLATLAAAPAPAAPAPVQAGELAARKSLGLELARLLNGEEATVAAMTRMLHDTLPETMLRNRAVRDAESARPGAVDAVVAAAVPVIIGHLRTELPRLWPKLGDFYAANLGEQDLRAALAFYRSPTGNRIVALMQQGMDFTAMLKDIQNDGGSEPSANRVRSATKSGARATVHQLSKRELADAARFARTPEGKRLIALGPRLDEVMAEWASRPDPAFDAELQRVTAAKVAELKAGQ